MKSCWNERMVDEIFSNPRRFEVVYFTSLNRKSPIPVVLEFVFIYINDETESPKA